MEIQNWGAELDPRNQDDKFTVLAYADDVTVFAASKDQAANMLKEMAEALEGLNLQLLPEKCSALWSLKPEGSDRENRVGASSSANRGIPGHPRPCSGL